MDSTCLVLLSVLALFDVTRAGDLEKHSGILSHSKKFSLLLHRLGFFIFVILSPLMLSGCTYFFHIYRDRGAHIFFKKGSKM
jgi:hypothetical protein